MKTTHWLAVIFTLSWLGGAQAAHITDKLLAGLYAKPASGQKPVQLLSSGTPVEVLEKSGGYQRVKLADGTEGWVNGSYITDEKPAQARLLEAQAQIADLKERLAEAVAKACPPDEEAARSVPDPDAEGTSQKPQEQAGDDVVEAPPVVDCAPMEAELDDVRDRMAEAVRLLGATPSSAPAPLAGQLGWAAYWPWIAMATTLLVGLVLGILLVQQRLSRRFGKGFRL